MIGPAHFRVDPKLTRLLGESYRSTEQALKELIDNAWDADAEHVSITLPAGMTDGPIVVQDDGCGMTQDEVRQEYLNIASDRRTRKGDRTQNLNRLAKGRKGIGKFAGLAAANVMELDTRTRGRKTSLRVSKQDLVDAQGDLEVIDLPIASDDCAGDANGTTITLSDLNQKLSFPSPAKLRELLVLEYGREPRFSILVNGEPLAHEDIPGQQFSVEANLLEAGPVKIRFTIMDQPTKARQAGMVIRVGGKIVGSPTFLGLEKRDDIPPKLLNRLVGEIEADSLDTAVTADWGAFLENSKLIQEVRAWAVEQITPKVDEAFKKEISLARGRRQQEISRRLAMLPEHRREFAGRYLDRVLRRFYGEAEDKIDVLVALVFDAIEKDEYWVVCEKIEKASHADIVTFAESLDAFGLVDMAVMAQHATHRLKFLDYLDELATNSETLEQQMHKALESNLWVFGPEYSLMASNVTLARTITEYTGKKFKGERAKKRPDLLLSQNVLGHQLLIEFKRPSVPVGRKAEAQAKEYRDDLTPSHGKILVMIVGGSVDSSMSSLYSEQEVKFLSYGSVIATARTQLNWIINELTTSPQPARSVGAAQS